jgi:4-hydroxy-3-methylbut-2-enyl diphosphate reductase IspH
VVGLTAGASTPNNIVGEVIQRLERFASPQPPLV